MCSALVLSSRIKRRRSLPFPPLQLRANVLAISLAALCDNCPAYAHNASLRVISEACDELSRLKRVRCCAARVTSLNQRRSSSDEAVSEEVEFTIGVSSARY